MRIIFYISVLFLVLSCAQKTSYEQPDNLIPRDKMVDILYDLSIFQSQVNHNRDPEFNKSIPTFLKNRHGVDSAQFVNSNKYYASQIEEYQKMYNEVYDSLRVVIDRAEAEPYEPSK
ncbi:MAG: DUF4296 domain-containing protein [Flavobacteriales bacterium]|nr:DUF4296 domain-containing protein [Flavobacteriales bacterium]